VRHNEKTSVFRQAFHQLVVIAGAVGLMLVFFLVLPLMQTIRKAPTAAVFNSVDTASLPPPPPPPPPEPKKEEPEEKPPELMENDKPLDLSELELALDPGEFSGGWIRGDFDVKLASLGSGGDAVAALAGIAELDQEPRATYQPSPVLTPQVLKKAPGTVYIIFIVDERGRVQNPKVWKSDDPVFERPALAAVKKWRFEPGKRNGKPVRFPMRVPIVFEET
jgi:protein TonB